MPKNAKVDDYLEQLPAKHRGLAETIRRCIAVNAPEATEDFKWSQPVWEFNGPFAYIKAAKTHLTLGFWRGVALDEGRGWLNSGGEKMAHMKLRDEADLNQEHLAILIQQAVALNMRLGNPTKSK